MTITNGDFSDESEMNESYESPEVAIEASNLMVADMNHSGYQLLRTRGAVGWFMVLPTPFSSRDFGKHQSHVRQLRMVQVYSLVLAPKIGCTENNFGSRKTTCSRKMWGSLQRELHSSTPSPQNDSELLVCVQFQLRGVKCVESRPHRFPTWWYH